jgi:hypothetical protein
MKRFTVCISFIVISLMFVGVSYANRLGENCVGCWLFDEGSGEDVLDSSPNGNNGRLVNGPQWIDDGSFDRALQFDGSDDYVIVESPSNLPLGNEPRTMVARIKNTGMANSWGSIVVYGTGDCTGLMSGIGRQNGATFWGGCKDFQSGLEIPENEWSFVAFTYDQTNITVWVNDQSVPNPMTDFITPESHLFIGAETINNGDGFRAFFTGLIDEVAVYNVALTDDELAVLRTGIVAVSPSGQLTTTWGRLKNNH